eukprot:jgi/Mesvir1/21260/Mv21663-RA.1
MAAMEHAATMSSLKRGKLPQSVSPHVVGRRIAEPRVHLNAGGASSTVELSHAGMPKELGLHPEASPPLQVPLVRVFQQAASQRLSQHHWEARRDVAPAPLQGGVGMSRGGEWGDSVAGSGHMSKPTSAAGVRLGQSGQHWDNALLEEDSGTLGPWDSDCGDGREVNQMAAATKRKVIAKEDTAAKGPRTVASGPPEARPARLTSANTRLGPVASSHQRAVRPGSAATLPPGGHLKSTRGGPRAAAPALSAEFLQIVAQYAPDEYDRITRGASGARTLTAQPAAAAARTVHAVEKGLPGGVSAAGLVNPLLRGDSPPSSPPATKRTRPDGSKSNGNGGIKLLPVATSHPNVRRVQEPARPAAVPAYASSSSGESSGREEWEEEQHALAGQQAGQRERGAVSPHRVRYDRSGARPAPDNGSARVGGGKASAAPVAPKRPLVGAQERAAVRRAEEAERARRMEALARLTERAKLGLKANKGSGVASKAGPSRGATAAAAPSTTATTAEAGRRDHPDGTSHGDQGGSHADITPSPRKNVRRSASHGKHCAGGQQGVPVATSAVAAAADGRTEGATGPTARKRYSKPPVPRFKHKAPKVASAPEQEGAPKAVRRANIELTMARAKQARPEDLMPPAKPSGEPEVPKVRSWAVPEGGVLGEDEDKVAKVRTYMEHRREARNRQALATKRAQALKERRRKQILRELDLRASRAIRTHDFKGYGTHVKAGGKVGRRHYALPFPAQRPAWDGSFEKGAGHELDVEGETAAFLGVSGRMTSVVTHPGAPHPPGMHLPSGTLGHPAHPQRPGAGEHGVEGKKAAKNAVAASSAQPALAPLTRFSGLDSMTTAVVGAFVPSMPRQPPPPPPRPKLHMEDSLAMLSRARWFTSAGGKMHEGRREDIERQVQGLQRLERIRQYASKQKSFMLRKVRRAKGRQPTTKTQQGPRMHTASGSPRHHQSKPTARPHHKKHKRLFNVSRRSGLKLRASSRGARHLQARSIMGRAVRRRRTQAQRDVLVANTTRLDGRGGTAHMRGVSARVPAPPPWGADTLHPPPGQTRAAEPTTESGWDGWGGGQGIRVPMEWRRAGPSGQTGGRGSVHVMPGELPHAHPSMPPAPPGHGAVLGVQEGDRVDTDGWRGSYGPAAGYEVPQLTRPAAFHVPAQAAPVPAGHMPVPATHAAAQAATHEQEELSRLREVALRLSQRLRQQPPTSSAQGLAADSALRAGLGAASALLRARAPATTSAATTVRQLTSWAATTVQRWFRGYLVRRRYRVGGLVIHAHKPLVETRSLAGPHVRSTPAPVASVASGRRMTEPHGTTQQGSGRETTFATTRASTSASAIGATHEGTASQKGTVPGRAEMGEPASRPATHTRHGEEAAPLGYRSEGRSNEGLGTSGAHAQSDPLPASHPMYATTGQMRAVGGRPASMNQDAGAAPWTSLSMTEPLLAGGGVFGGASVHGARVHLEEPQPWSSGSSDAADSDEEEEATVDLSTAGTVEDEGSKRDESTLLSIDDSMVASTSATYTSPLLPSGGGSVATRAERPWIAEERAERAGPGPVDADVDGGKGSMLKLFMAARHHGSGSASISSLATARVDMGSGDKAPVSHLEAKYGAVTSSHGFEGDGAAAHSRSKWGASGFVGRYTTDGPGAAPEPSSVVLAYAREIVSRQKQRATATVPPSQDMAPPGSRPVGAADAASKWAPGPLLGGVEDEAKGALMPREERASGLGESVKGNEYSSDNYASESESQDARVATTSASRSHGNVPTQHAERAVPLLAASQGAPGEAATLAGPALPLGAAVSTSLRAPEPEDGPREAGGVAGSIFASTAAAGPARLSHGFGLPRDERLSPRSLEKRFHAELQLLEEVEAAHRDLLGIERDRAISHAHQETVNLARLLEKQAAAREQAERLEAWRAQQEAALQARTDQLLREMRGEGLQHLKDVTEVFVRQFSSSRQRSSTAQTDAEEGDGMAGDGAAHAPTPAGPLAGPLAGQTPSPGPRTTTARHPPPTSGRAGAGGGHDADSVASAMDASYSADFHSVADQEDEVEEQIPLHTPHLQRGDDYVASDASISDHISAESGGTPTTSRSQSVDGVAESSIPDPSFLSGGSRRPGRSTSSIVDEVAGMSQGLGGASKGSRSSVSQVASFTGSGDGTRTHTGSASIATSVPADEVASSASDGASSGRARQGLPPPSVAKESGGLPVAVAEGDPSSADVSHELSAQYVAAAEARFRAEEARLKGEEKALAEQAATRIQQLQREAQAARPGSSAERHAKQQERMVSMELATARADIARQLAILRSDLMRQKLFWEQAALMSQLRGHRGRKATAGDKGAGGSSKSKPAPLATGLLDAGSAWGSPAGLKLTSPIQLASLQGGQRAARGPPTAYASSVGSEDEVSSGKLGGSGDGRDVSSDESAGASKATQGKVLAAVTSRLPARVPPVPRGSAACAPSSRHSSQSIVSEDAALGAKGRGGGTTSSLTYTDEFESVVEEEEGLVRGSPAPGKSSSSIKSGIRSAIQSDIQSNVQSEIDSEGFYTASRSSARTSASEIVSEIEETPRGKGPTKTPVTSAVPKSTPKPTAGTPAASAAAGGHSSSGLSSSAELRQLAELEEAVARKRKEAQRAEMAARKRALEQELMSLEAIIQGSKKQATADIIMGAAASPASARRTPHATAVGGRQEGASSARGGGSVGAGRKVGRVAATERDSDESISEEVASHSSASGSSVQEQIPSEVSGATASSASGQEVAESGEVASVASKGTGRSRSGPLVTTQSLHHSGASLVYSDSFEASEGVTDEVGSSSVDRAPQASSSIADEAHRVSSQLGGGSSGVRGGSASIVDDMQGVTGQIGEDTMDEQKGAASVVEDDGHWDQSRIGEDTFDAQGATASIVDDMQGVTGQIGEDTMDEQRGAASVVEDDGHWDQSRIGEDTFDAQGATASIVEDMQGVTGQIGEDTMDEQRGAASMVEDDGRWDQSRIGEDTFDAPGATASIVDDMQGLTGQIGEDTMDEQRGAASVVEDDGHWDQSRIGEDTFDAPGATASIVDDMQAVPGHTKSFLDTVDEYDAEETSAPDIVDEEDEHEVASSMSGGHSSISTDEAASGAVSSSKDGKGSTTEAITDDLPSAGAPSRSNEGSIPTDTASIRQGTTSSSKGGNGSIPEAVPSDVEEEAEIELSDVPDDISVVDEEDDQGGYSGEETEDLPLRPTSAARAPLAEDAGASIASEVEPSGDIHSVEEAYSVDDEVADEAHLGDSSGQRTSSRLPTGHRPVADASLTETLDEVAAAGKATSMDEARTGSRASSSGGDEEALDQDTSDRAEDGAGSLVVSHGGPFDDGVVMPQVAEAYAQYRSSLEAARGATRLSAHRTLADSLASVADQLLYRLLAGTLDQLSTRQLRPATAGPLGGLHLPRGNTTSGTSVAAAPMAHGMAQEARVETDDARVGSQPLAAVGSDMELRAGAAGTSPEPAAVREDDMAVASDVEGEADLSISEEASSALMSEDEGLSPSRPSPRDSPISPPDDGQLVRPADAGAAASTDSRAAAEPEPLARPCADAVVAGASAEGLVDAALAALLQDTIAEMVGVLASRRDRVQAGQVGAQEAVGSTQSEAEVAPASVPQPARVPEATSSASSEVRAPEAARTAPTDVAEMDDEEEDSMKDAFPVHVASSGKSDLEELLGGDDDDDYDEDDFEELPVEEEVMSPPSPVAAHDKPSLSTHELAGSPPTSPTEVDPEHVDTREQAIRDYVAAVMDHAGLLEEGAVWDGPNTCPGLDLEGFLALERSRPPSNDFKHIHNKLVFDATNEALATLYPHGTRPASIDAAFPPWLGKVAPLKAPATGQALLAEVTEQVRPATCPPCDCCAGGRI